MYKINKRFIAEFNQTLLRHDVMLVCAESMTGGLLASTICSAKGALSVLKGSIVAYDQKVKTETLQVPPTLIEKYTAESAEVTEALCNGLQRLFPGDLLYVAMTGVAEKTPDNRKKEGQIYIHLHYKGSPYRFAHVIPTSYEKDLRNSYRVQAVAYILDCILAVISLDASKRK